MSNIQLYINFSNTLHKIGVSNIGLKSVLILWGLEILLTGITVADFQRICQHGGKLQHLHGELHHQHSDNTLINMVISFCGNILEF